MEKNNIGIIGLGNMGSCLLNGLLKKGFPPKKIFVSDPSLSKLEKIKKNFNVSVSIDNKEIVKKADVVLLAVKPQILEKVAKEIAPLIQAKSALIISIASGITTSQIQTWLGEEKTSIIRAMPNTPAIINYGTTGLFANAFTNEEQRMLAENLFNSVGITDWLDQEDLIDTVTALSGSGPAYIFLVMEALQQAAEKLGLPQNISHSFTLQTVLGASRLALEGTSSLEELRKNVTSPGGTTEQAIKVFEQNHIRDIFYKALEAAVRRAKELSEQSNEGKK